MNNWVDLEHKLWQQLQSLGIAQKKILVGFSGGADSVALLWALQRVKKHDVVACYVHHGESSNPVIKAYRNKAAEFCKDFCETHNIPFEVRQRKKSDLSKKPTEVLDQELRSEEALRDFRAETLSLVMHETGSNFIALGHHCDDLLETRLLRLIRGTGPQGLESMQSLQGHLFRPFLQTSKKMLQDYLEGFELKPLEDPSNQELEPFRNWLRQSWLPALEERQEGATQSLARSLDLLSKAVSQDGRELEDPLQKVFLSPSSLSRLAFRALTRNDQMRALARLALQNNKRDFTHGHIKEVLKRLDNSQKDLMFRTGGVDWYVNAQQISMLGLSSKDEKD